MDYIQRFLSTITKNCKRQAEFTQLEKPSSLLKYHIHSIQELNLSFLLSIISLIHQFVKGVSQFCEKQLILMVISGK